MFRITCSKCGESADIGEGMPAMNSAAPTTVHPPLTSSTGTFKAGDPVPKAYWDMDKPLRWGAYKLWTEKVGKDWFFKAPDPQ